MCLRIPIVVWLGEKLLKNWYRIFIFTGLQSQSSIVHQDLVPNMEFIVQIILVRGNVTKRYKVLGSLNKLKDLSPRNSPKKVRGSF